MKWNYKWIVLAIVVAVTMAALILVNLQNAQNAGPRNPASALAVEKHEAGQRMRVLSWIRPGGARDGA